MINLKEEMLPVPEKGEKWILGFLKALISEYTSASFSAFNCLNLYSETWQDWKPDSTKIHEKNPTCGW